MEKNTRYAINKGYPLVKIALTVQDTEILLGNLSALKISGISGNIAYMSETPILEYLAQLLHNALKQLEA